MPAEPRAAVRRAAAFGRQQGEQDGAARASLARARPRSQLTAGKRVMPLPKALAGRLALPVVGAPMFIVSSPALVIAQCKAGVLGCFPSLNARPEEELARWIAEIRAALAGDAKSAPSGVHLSVRTAN